MINRKWASGLKTRKVSTDELQDKYLNPSNAGGKAPMFNSRGEVNANSRKEVFENAQKFAKLNDEYSDAYKDSKIEKLASLYTDEEKNKIFASALGDQAQWIKFGQEGIVPLILRELDYKGFIRQVFHTHNVAQGQVIKYEKDISVTALVIAENGDAVESQVKGDRVFPGEFTVTSNPTIEIKEVAVRDFDAVERAKDKATFQVMLKEDRNGLRLLYSAATIENSQINITGSVNKAVIESLTNSVESWGLIANKILMNRAEFGDLRSAINTNDYDPVTAREVWLNGMFGNFWGYNILVAAGKSDTRLSIPAGMIFAVTEPRFIGAMGIRVELEAHPADKFTLGQPRYGWLFVEVISQTVVNPRSVAMGVKSTTVVPDWMTA